MSKLERLNWYAVSIDYENDKHILFSGFAHEGLVEEEGESVIFPFLKEHPNTICLMQVRCSIDKITRFLTLIDKYDLSKNQFHVMVNELRERDFFIQAGIPHTFLGSHGLNRYDLLTYNPLVKKEYNIVCISNFPKRDQDPNLHYKRWFACPTDIDNIAIIGGHTDLEYRKELIQQYGIKVKYANDQKLFTAEKVDILQKSKIAIIMSTIEGACFSSHEYLACGLPIVSCKNRGGRNFYYNNYNSIICEPDKESITNACKEMLRKVDNGEVNSGKIREDFIRLRNEQFMVFKNMMREIYERLEINNFENEFEHEICIKPFFIRQEFQFFNWGHDPLLD